MPGRKLDNLSGKEFATLKVLRFSHMEWQGENKKHGMSYYLCECKVCGKRAVLPRSNILQGIRNRCIHYDGVWFVPGNYFD